MGSRKNKKQKPPRLKRLRRQPNRMPVPSKPRADKKWTFSFQYWQQQKFFGLKGESQKWFISLFDRLAALSKEPLEAVRLDGGRAKAHRFHPLSWTASSAITKDEFYSYLPDYYRNNKEIEILQFQIETSKGRVIGFLDAANVFQIVLLDPKHNMQLSRRGDYTVVKTDFALNDYQVLEQQLKQIQHKAQLLRDNKLSAQNFANDVERILNSKLDERLICLDKRTYQDIQSILQDRGHEFDNSVELLVTHAIEQLKSTCLNQDQD